MINGGKQVNKISSEYDKSMPLFSIITVVYNGEKTIEKTINSVLNQTYKNIEYIIIDGNSKDKTVDVIKKYEDEIEYWQSEPDCGIYDAMNKGINLAKGDYICLLNADDWYEDNACQIVAEQIQKNKADVYYGIARVLDNDLETVDIHGSTVKILNRSSVAHQTCFVSKEIYSNYLYDTKYKSAADYDLVCKLYKAGFKFQFIEKILVNFRLDGMSGTTQGQLERYCIMNKYGYISKIKYLVHILSLKIALLMGK